MVGGRTTCVAKREKKPQDVFCLIYGNGGVASLLMAVGVSSIECGPGGFLAAKQTYFEYQHSHNPPTNEGIYDYAFRRGGGAFYVLDGRGHRDIERNRYRILGSEQFRRFANWIDNLDPNNTPFLFVVSAVPVLHIRPSWFKKPIMRNFKKEDWMDSWGHDLHNQERQELMQKLFQASANGFKVMVVSGDRHISAAFGLTDNAGNCVYQLTSSPITHNINWLSRGFLRKATANDGETPEGYHYERLAIYDKVSYALISADPQTHEASFSIYSRNGCEETVHLD